MTETKTFDSIGELAAKLSNEDLVHLIHCMHERIEVYVGTWNNCCLSASLDPEVPACLDGSAVQINLVQDWEQGDGDIRKADWFRWAYEREEEQS